MDTRPSHGKEENYTKVVFTLQIIKVVFTLETISTLTVIVYPTWRRSCSNYLGL